MWGGCGSFRSLAKRDLAELSCWTTCRFVQESRNNIENTLRAKMKESTEEVSVLEKRAKVRGRLLRLEDAQ